MIISQDISRLCDIQISKSLVTSLDIAKATHEKQLSNSVFPNYLILTSFSYELSQTLPRSRN